MLEKMWRKRREQNRERENREENRIVGENRIGVPTMKNSMEVP